MMTLSLTSFGVYFYLQSLQVSIVETTTASYTEAVTDMSVSLPTTSPHSGMISVCFTLISSIWFKNFGQAALHSRIIEQWLLFNLLIIFL